IALAAGTTAALVAVQERTLSRDLERAASQRLDRATHAAEKLVQSHLAALAERYQAVSSTPQFRANLEVEDPPTLGFYAGQLADRLGAAGGPFPAEGGEVMASAGDPALAARAADVHEGLLLAHAGK